MKIKSVVVCKKALAKFRALRTKANKEHKELIDAKKTEVVNRYKLAEEQLHYYTTRGASYTTSEHYGYKMNDHARAVQELKTLKMVNIILSMVIC